MTSRYEPGRGLGDRRIRRIREQVLRIEVCHDCPGPTRPGLPDRYSESGRGLFFVAISQTGTGVGPTATEKCC